MFRFLYIIQYHQEVQNPFCSVTRNPNVQAESWRTICSDKKYNTISEEIVILHNNRIVLNLYLIDYITVFESTFHSVLNHCTVGLQYVAYYQV